MKARTLLAWKAALGLFILICCELASGERPPRSPLPADILDKESGILTALRNSEKTPSAGGTLKCGVFIAPNGTLVSTHCYFRKSTNDELYEILLAAVNQVEAKPAMVDGEPKWVWFQFQVHYDINSQEYTVDQNLAEKSTLQGTSLQGPQRHFRPRKCGALRGRALVVTQHINKLGEVDRVEFSPEVKKIRLKKAILNCHLGMRYIPATKNGIPVDSILVEPFLQLRYNRMLEVKDRSLFGFGRRRL